MTNLAKHRTGFAMITAIMLLSLTAVTITLLGSALVNQARRTQLAAEDAQLRQLLVAGADIARTKLSSSGSFTVDLPPSLRDESAALTIQIQDNPSGQKIATIKATFPHHSLSQQLTFTSQNSAWQLTGATLGF
jgi:hypothetical protein